ncbi:hypothetical protein LTR53_000844 [Teratosphaeriaceae sp. CCFEE 6253]|nr:hypothetical protein LTR53_000844 [Teratosphaeriaceae sp. CCFEE 6253]
MNLDPPGIGRSSSPASSGRSSPVPRAERRAVEDELYRADKGLRRYGALIDRAVDSWDTAPQEWADYIAFLARLLKAVQSHPKNAPILPHTQAVAYRLSQCLNPALPSGVHQKALEVYTYIFRTFGSKYLSSHLSDYLPGLAPVLAFASLSVRPGLYALFEQHIVKISQAELHPAMKALILSLLPALEEETGEDFGRALSITQSLEVASNDEVELDPPTGFFWQTMFLCIVSAPSRRLGALKYLIRRLPKFVSRAGMPSSSSHEGRDDLEDLPEDARAAISPEAGLLVRCFAAGLSDVNALVQRGFLELLVTHLPLSSPVLRRGVDETDLDLLMLSVLNILLRRDTSLNRRVWSWLLGPELTNPPSPLAERLPRVEVAPTQQMQHFHALARAPLERCLLAMLNTDDDTPATRARPFRICLSLMDRWEIGGTVLPDIFFPAMESFHAFSKDATPSVVSEVQRSVSLFFDGVEAGVIWSTLAAMIHDAVQPEGFAPTKLDLATWILNTFNLRDEEMITVHARLVAVLLLGKLCMQDVHTAGHDYARALQIANGLVDLIPPRAFVNAGTDAQVRPQTKESTEAYVKAVTQFYERKQQNLSTSSQPFDGHTTGTLLLRMAVTLTLRSLQSSLGPVFQGNLQVLLVIVTKVPGVDHAAHAGLLDAISETLSMSQTTGAGVALPTLSAIVAFLLPMPERPHAAQEASMARLLPYLAMQLWQHLSPSTAKYHVEATRLLWQLETLSLHGEALEASLLGFMRSVHDEGPDIGDSSVGREEAVRRFSVLWNHSVPSNAGYGTLGPSRRASSTSTAADSAQIAHRIQTLAEPLFRVIDLLREPSSPAAEAAGRWLGSLTSLDSVLSMLLVRFQTSILRLNQHIAKDERSQRDSKEQVREIAYLLCLFEPLLSHGSGWTWECLTAHETDTTDGGRQTGMMLLTQECLQLLAVSQQPVNQLHRDIVGLLQILVDGPAAMEIKRLRVEERLLDRMASCLGNEELELQSPLLRLITSAIRLRVREDSTVSLIESGRRMSVTDRRRSTQSTGRNADALAVSKATSPPPQLVYILRKAFVSRAARPYMEQWVAFLLDILPTFATAIFSSLLPLIETLCIQLHSFANELMELTTTSGSGPSFMPDSSILSLLEALEATLARAHECLAIEAVPEESANVPSPAVGFLSGVTSGVFKAQGPPSRTSLANSRLTVILAFQDSIRCCLDIWLWSNNPTSLDHYDRSCASTTSYAALRLRNKTRYLLEQMFAAEPLESLEGIVAYWRSETRAESAGAVINLFQVMQGSRPKHVLPAILDSLCSRIVPSALPPARQSSQSTELTADDVSIFLLAYLRSTEDDAMDEIWVDCITFVRDVLANPMPYRHHMPALLALVHLLSQKVANTKYGEQKRMRKDLADTFLKLLAATFTTMSSGSFAEAGQGGTRSGLRDDANPDSIRPLLVLRSIVDDIGTILDSQDRIATVMTSISTSVLTPIIHSKAFPSSLSSEHLELLLSVAKKAPTSKTWKKDVTEAFNDPRLLTTPPDVLKGQWLPILYQWTARDKDRMTELLSRLTAPTTAGIMFGVGANAARLEADRRTQLNLRRLCLLLQSSPEDTWVSYLRDLDEKLVELFAATASSSPSAAVKADLYVLCRALILSFSAVHLAPLWPTINSNLQAALTSILGSQKSSAFTNLSVLQACKLLDQLVMLSPDEFQLHEWLYIADTVDAVYRPTEYAISALADQVAESLGPIGSDEDRMIATPTVSNGESGHRRRRLLLHGISIETDDIKAMERDEFFSIVLRPFLSQLSIHAYEGVYSMEVPDVEACRRCLLEDLTDLKTIVS